MTPTGTSRPISRIILTAQVAAGVLTAAACGSTSQEITAPAASKCAIAVTASTSTFGAEGGGGQLAISTQRECQWTAGTDASWIALKSPLEGQGSATIEFTVARTDDPVSRSATLKVSDQRVQITQSAAACRYQLSLTQATVPSSGAGGDVDVTASSPMCEWTARSEADWITIRAGSTGRGNGRVTFEAAPSGGPPRTGRILAADQPVTVTQNDGCTYTLAPSTIAVPAAGGAGSVTVTAPAGCPWSSSAGANWMSIASGATGSGAGTVQFTAAANGGPARSAALVIGGRTTTVNQASGCAYSISPTEGQYPKAGATGSIAVSTAAACPWSAASQAEWLAITSGSSGSGPGTVQFTVAPSAGEARAGTLSVAGRIFTASQERGCGIELSDTSATFGAGGGIGGFLVTTACPWRTIVEGGVTWVILTRGDRANGTGPVWFVVLPNDGPPRTATLLVEDHHRFTIYQEGKQ